MSTLLQINATCNFGSTGRIAEEIAQRASIHGWKCVIAHGGRYVRSSDFETIQISSKLDNKIHALKSMFFGMHGLGSFVATRHFIESIKTLKPDIIHLHNIHGYYINYRVLFDYLEKVDIPIVWTLHDCWTMTGQCTHFLSINCTRWKTGCCNCIALASGYKTLIDRSSTNWQSKKNAFTSVKRMTIVPVSYWLDGIVQESYLNKYSSMVIHNGIDLEVFKPLIKNRASLGLNDRFTILGVASHWHKSKGLDDFIELSKIPEFQVVLIGVQKELLEKLPNSIKAIQRTENRQKLVEYYTSADVFVNPTRSDSFPTVNLEALACGTPVITYPTGGSPEAVDEKTGIVTDHCDFHELLTAIEQIRVKGKDYYSQACVERAKKEFDRNIRFNDYVALYNKLIS